MIQEENKNAGHAQSKIGETLKRHGLIILYILQLLLVLMYVEAEVQPFVYVHF